MQKSIIILVIFLVTLSAAQARSTAIAKGYVTINIINQPPRILSIEFSPEVAYQDSLLECTPQIRDEVPDQVSTEYKWYINSVFVSNSQTLTNFNEQDTVTCEATPIDSAGLRGNTLTNTIQIQGTSLTTKATMFMMNALGAETTTQETIALQQQGLAAITGYVVGEINTSAQVMSVIFLVLILIVLININIAMRYLIKKKSFF